MYEGKKLGKAIKIAVDLKLSSGKVATKTKIAEHFRIKLPSLYDWMKSGSITKSKLPLLWKYFSDVVDMSHWGLTNKTIPGAQLDDVTAKFEGKIINPVPIYVDPQYAIKFLSHPPAGMENIADNLIKTINSLADIGTAKNINGKSKTVLSKNSKK